jgi:hypothetical protein
MFTTKKWVSNHSLALAANTPEVVSKPHLRPNDCVADLFYGSSHLRRDSAFSIGLRLLSTLILKN